MKDKIESIIVFIVAMAMLSVIVYACTNLFLK